MTGADRSEPAAALWADTSFLREVQYKTDVTLAMHMLYHVPEPDRAVRELRRITRPGGRLIVGLNGEDHLRELRDVVAAALVSLGQPMVPLMHERIGLDHGEVLLRSEFASITRHDFVSRLLLPGPEPVAAYVRSMSEAARRADPEPLIAAVISRLPSAPGEVFEVTTHSGCLICA